ncbi:MAG: hypothetical protein HC875_29710 [Anaerolineales bacterium]|nr:hypothetical protein [Anaerolineales bacterium]
MNILSWGCGLQSTLLLEMSASGLLPKLDLAIFSDTGFEHEYSYEVFDFYAARAKKAGIEVIKIGGQDILGDSYKKISVPLFIEKTGRMTIRKCTRDYKIRPIQRVIRDFLGVNRRGRLAADLVTLWLGITIDEIDRAKPSRVGYINHTFPLLDLNLHRLDCEKWFSERGLPIPKKSSCKFCPFKSKPEWSELRENHPKDFILIADLEAHINQKGLVKLDKKPVNVHFVPSGDLIQADFSYQLGLFGSMCDGGFCNS